MSTEIAGANSTDSNKCKAKIYQSFMGKIVVMGGILAHLLFRSLPLNKSLKYDKYITKYTSSCL